MALRLTVQRSAWEAHIRSVVAALGDVVPVVKGNGYGFGRATLHTVAATLSEFVCVGTIHELDSLAPGVAPVVLTPTMVPPVSTSAVLTVGSRGDVAALHEWRGRVIVKLQSSMRRYGAAPSELEGVVAAADAAGLDIVGYALHLPLAGSDADRLAEIEVWLELLDPRHSVWLSHIEPPSLAALRDRHTDRRFRLRVGTRLWHGDKSFLHLHAGVLAVRPIRAGDVAGYQLTEIAHDGHLVMVGAGSAHGIAPLPGGTSPFHFAHTRLALIEPPHMHTSMILAPAGTPCPSAGDRVDVQRPLISTLVDDIEWV